MANVNVGKRTKEQEAEALKKLEQEVTASGDAKIIEENGAKYAVTTSFGMTIKTRIA